MFELSFAARMLQVYFVIDASVEETESVGDYDYNYMTVIMILIIL